MPDIICEKCGKHYKLKKGESPKEFNCECGGKLKYVQNFGAHFDEELDPLNELNICPDCEKILDEAKSCKEGNFKPKKSEKSKSKVKRQNRI